jgi:hypothetical protein
VRALSLALVALVLAATTACLGAKSEKRSSALSIWVGNSFVEGTYTVSCDPPTGTAPNPAALCRTIKGNEPTMLHAKNPTQLCGAFNPIGIHVSGLWEGEPIDAEVDACSGNRVGENLWMSQLPSPPLRFGGGSLEV